MTGIGSFLLGVLTSTERTKPTAINLKLLKVVPRRALFLPPLEVGSPTVRKLEVNEASGSVGVVFAPS